MHKEVSVKIISAFTKDGKGGNLAGVVYNSNLTTEEKQEIARQLNLSETVFIDESNGYKFQYFTPNSEIDFCGHATLAALSTIDFKDKITINVKKFDIEVYKDNELVYFSVDNPEVRDVSIDENEVLESLGLDKVDLDLEMKVVYSGLNSLIISVKDEFILDTVNPDYEKITEISKKYNVVGYHVFTLESEYAATTRNFAPLYGIDEESATGSANSALAYYLYKKGIRKDRYEFLQGVSLQEESLVYVDLTVGKEVRVYVSGHSTEVEKRIIKLNGGN